MSSLLRCVSSCSVPLLHPGALQKTSGIRYFRTFPVLWNQQASKGVRYSDVLVGIPKEIFKNERRVAVSPAGVQALVKQGFRVQVETGAGEESKFSDEHYREAGATIVDTQSSFDSDLVLKHLL